jgi:hypothetical protein
MSALSNITRRRFATLGVAAAAGLSGSSLTAQSADRPSLKSEFLMDLVFKTSAPMTIGPRGIAGLTEGTFQGPRLKGTLVTPAGEWGGTRPDGVYVIDVRLELRTDDAALIFAFYRGIVYTPPAGSGVRYWAITPVFETASEKYSWLNRVVCVGVAYAVPKDVGDVAYHIYQILM